MRKILIVVDMQKNFVDGALGTKEAIAIVPAVVDKIKEYDSGNIFVTIAKWETDGGLPDRDNLRRLSEVIGVSVDDLHKVIDRSGGNNEIEVNITSDVIASLESHGYKVIRQDDMGQ